MAQSSSSSSASTVLPKANGSAILDTIVQHVLSGGDCLLLLDYDGTCTPIVADPMAALLPAKMGRTLEQVSSVISHTAIITGRSVETITSFLGPAISSKVQIAASHGYDIRGPFATKMVGQEYLSDLGAARDALTQSLAPIPGAAVEDNRFSVTVHYRNVAPDDVPLVAQIVERYVHEKSGGRLVIRPGNCVHELRPNMAWDKGRAAALLVRELRMDRPDVTVIAVGDDITDEDMFRVLHPQHNEGHEGGDEAPPHLCVRGIPIIVSPAGQAVSSSSPDGSVGQSIIVPRRTAATYALSSPAELQQFLQHLCDHLMAAQQQQQADMTTESEAGTATPDAAVKLNQMLRTQKEAQPSPSRLFVSPSVTGRFEL